MKKQQFNQETPVKNPSLGGINHYQVPSKVGELIAKAMIAVCFLIFGWFAGVFILGQAGFKNPTQALAENILSLLIIIGILVLVKFGAENILNTWLTYKDRQFEHQERMADKNNERWRYQQLMARSLTTDSRQQGSQARLVNLVYLVMLEAYDQVAENGQFKGNGRPWSRREIQKLMPLDGQRPTEAEATQIKTYLLDNQIITGPTNYEQINLERYPDIASVQRLAYYPITVIQNDYKAGEGVSSWSITGHE